MCVCVREIGGESSACVGLRNDHKAVMKLIEERLHEIHWEARRRREAGVSGEGGGGREEGKVLPATFARVSQVTEGSPSAIAVRADVPRGEWSPVTGRVSRAGPEGWGQPGRVWVSDCCQLH